MKKTLEIGAGIGIIFIGIFLAIWFSQGCGQKIKIVKETKTIYQTIKVPQTSEEFQSCYYSHIEIKGTTRDDWLDIDARDDCKSSQKSFQIGCFAQPKDIFMIKLGVLAGYNKSLSKFDWGYQGSFDYLRMWTNLGVGAGLDGYYMNVSKDIYAGAHISLAIGK